MELKQKAIAIFTRGTKEEQVDVLLEIFQTKNPNNGDNLEMAQKTLQDWIEYRRTYFQKYHME